MARACLDELVAPGTFGLLEPSLPSNRLRNPLTPRRLFLASGEPTILSPSKFISREVPGILVVCVEPQDVLPGNGDKLLLTLDVLAFGATRGGRSDIESISVVQVEKS